MIKFTSRKIYDEFTSTGGGGVNYLNGSILDKLTCVIEFYFQRALENKRIRFEASDDSIELLNTFDADNFATPGTFSDKGFKVGQSITITGTTNNNLSTTITEIVNERKIKVADSLTDETAPIGNIFDVTPVTAIDFYYNLIENDAAESYKSLTDKNTSQKYTVSGIDADDLVTETKFVPSTNSLGWITENLTAAKLSETKIIGMDISSDFKQQFKITQTLFVSPYFLRAQLKNYQDGAPPPDYFNDLLCLKLIHKIDAKDFFDNPNPMDSGSAIIERGNSSWFDENNNGRQVPEYYLDSIEYEDADTAEALDRIDINKKCHVTIVLKSRNGQFSDGNTKLVLSHVYCPLDESWYVDTPSRTLRQNFGLDRKMFTLGAASSNGENSGTTYQILKNITSTFTDASTITVEFDYDTHVNIKTFLKGRNSNDRNYLFSIATQDKDITTTAKHDRVCVLCDFQNADWNQTNEDLFELVDYIRIYEFPNDNINPLNSVEVYEGDPLYVQLPFRLETAISNDVSPSVKEIYIQVVAYKTGKEDFILQERKIDGSQFKKLMEVPQIDVDEPLGYLTIDVDPSNRVKLTRDNFYNSGTKKGYVFEYGIVARYEDWLEVIPAAEGIDIDIFKDLETVTHRWSNYDAAEGWNLKLRINVAVSGYEGELNEYFTETSFRVLKTETETTSGISANLKFYAFNEDTDEYDIEINGIQYNAKTLVRCEYTGDFSPFPGSNDDIYGYLFADEEGVGSVFKRRFASSVIESEADSPWILTEEDPMATETRADGNARVNLYGTTEIHVESIFDTEGRNDFKEDEILIYPRLGFWTSNRIRLFSDEENHLFSDGEQMLFKS